MSKRGSESDAEEFYVLYLAMMAPNDALQIDVSKYQILKHAVEGFRAALSFEDRFTMLIDNYIEFESKLFGIGILSNVRDLEYDDFTNMVRSANLALSNLLSTCRQYVDHNRRQLSSLLPPDGASYDIVVSNEYDASLSYRFLEQLRNHYQHKDIPVRELSIGVRSGGAEGRFPVSSILVVDFVGLRADSAFKSHVLDELERLEVEPSLILMVREYMASIARIHLNLRKALSAQIVEWDEAIQTAVTEYKNAACSNNVIGLSVGRMVRGGRPTKLFNVSGELGEILRKRQAYNYCPVNIDKFYVSSEVRQKMKR